MLIYSRLLECYTGDEPKRRISDITKIVIHRVGKAGPEPHPELGDDAGTIAAWFKRHPEATGSPFMPYTFVVGKDGHIEQSVPLTVKTPHARAMNKSGLAVALVGDFRHAKPPLEQEQGLRQLLIRLYDTLGPLSIVGHSECGETAMRDGKKICPGKGLDLDMVKIYMSRWSEVVQ